MRFRSTGLLSISCARLAVWPALVVCSFFCNASAFEPGSEEFFEQKIRPVLVKHCYRCHSDDAEEIGASLWLDSAGGMQEGGDCVPVIRRGDAD